MLFVILPCLVSCIILHNYMLRDCLLYYCWAHRQLHVSVHTTTHGLVVYQTGVWQFYCLAPLVCSWVVWRSVVAARDPSPSSRTGRWEHCAPPIYYFRVGVCVYSDSIPSTRSLIRGSDVRVHGCHSPTHSVSPSCVRWLTGCRGDQDMSLASYALMHLLLVFAAFICCILDDCICLTCIQDFYTSRFIIHIPGPG